ncbi:MAG: MFS transporter [Acidobacteria bacterium]|nr:MFS transporter [Acidobacteriota bacterium]
MDFSSHPRLDWKALFALPGFRYYFAGMFISLFGTGMNFAGVTWYVLGATNSTVKVSLVAILVTLPGLVVPPFGGVLIDRVDRRWLGMALDLGRAAIVLATAALAYFGHIQLWQVFLMVLLLGVGFSIYWSTTNSLVQEVVPQGQLMGANAAVLIAVQGGMMTAGALVGFVYERAGLAGILGIDGATYAISALCLMRLRRGYFPPHQSFPPPAVVSPTIEAPPEMTEPALLEPVVEPGLAVGLLADMREGLRYLRTQPRVLAIGLTFACMMAGVISANVLVVALARDIVHAGARGYGYIVAGWAVGAIAGGLAAGELARRRPLRVLITALTILAVGHALLPYVLVLWAAVAMQALFGACRALGGVLTQSSIMTIVPRRLMGRTQSAFSVISTLLQVTMSFSLGWLGQHINLPFAFFVLGLLYAGAVAAAIRARALTRAASSEAA